MPRPRRLLPSGIIASGPSSATRPTWGRVIIPPVACGVARPPPPPLVPPPAVNDPAEKPELKAFLALVKNPLILSPTPDQKPVHFAGSVTVKKFAALVALLSTQAGTSFVQKSPTPVQKSVHLVGSVSVKNAAAFSPVFSTHAGTSSVQNSPTPSQKAVQCSGSVLVKKTFVLPRA